MTKNLYAEIIADGKHVDPVAVRIFWREKGAARAILITDGLSATGMPEGHYTLGGFDVEVKGRGRVAQRHRCRQRPYHGSRSAQLC